MAKKIKQKKDALITRAVPVADGTLVDNVVLLGAAGLKGYVITDRATTAKINEGTSAPGLADGEASVTLLGVSLVVELAITNAVAQFAAVYVTPGGAYTATATSNTKIGYALETLSGAGNADVALIG